MAYVVWRVFMKKYAKVRLGLHTSMVSPKGRRAIEYDDEVADEHAMKTSASKKVKNYLSKKCKGAFGVAKDRQFAATTSRDDTTSWYLDVNTSEIGELADELQERAASLECAEEATRHVANLIYIKRPPHEEPEPAPALLMDTQKASEEDGEIDDERRDADHEKRDVASLVDKYFGDLYENYKRSRKCLIRQARDLLIFDYYGCLERFENEFCVQASKLLLYLKDRSQDTAAPKGWPLCLGSSGIVVHLSPPDASCLKNNDCYVCLKTRSAPGLEVALTWRKHSILHCHTIVEFANPLNSLDDIMCSNIQSVSDLELLSYDDYDGTELPELLQNLLVSVEHAIERVPLDDLTLPCPQCLDYVPLEVNRDDTNLLCSCQCSCRNEAASSTTKNQKRDTSMQTSPMFDFAGSIPHIDSDAEDDKESIRSSGCPGKKMEIVRPRKITDLPEKLLLSGIYLPGTVDLEEKPIILCYAESISRAGLNKYEIAKLLLFYSGIPLPAVSEKGFVVLLMAETDDAYKILQLLDKSIGLIEDDIRITKYIIWRPQANEERTVTNKIPTVTVTDERSLQKHVRKFQAPNVCGGACKHDQKVWISFFKQIEPFLATCKTTGRSLLATLSKLRGEQAPKLITRRFLNHQCRQIAKALQMECLEKLQQDGRKTLRNLEEKREWLCDSADVRRKTLLAQNSFNAVDKVAKRLEQLEKERRDRLRELARFRTYQNEVNEMATWTDKFAEETLNNLVLLLSSATDSNGVKEVSLDFEKFFFSAWRQIEKAQDLIEECKNIKEVKGENLKESTTDLSTQMKTFKEKLEETRVQLENASRCFLLLESCHDILEDDNKEQEEFVKLALKSGNGKLKEICKVATKPKENTLPTQPPDKIKNFESSKEITATSTPIKPTQIRRRSISSHAFIYSCSHHANGEHCNCDESDNESTSISYKLKKKYLQTLQGGCSCPTSNARGQDMLERKNSATLGGIKEESVENILEKVESEHEECKRCDSGVSTGDNSVTEDFNFGKKRLQRTCSCQYCRESCVMCSTNSSSIESNAEIRQIVGNENHGLKSNSSDDIEDEFIEEKRAVSPVTANKHLYCHSSNLDLPSDALYCNMDPKTQKTLKYIIKEMIETERDYVRSLDYVIVNYMPEISREDIPQALRGQRNIVFGNIEKIFEFHSQHFLTELEECENNPLQVGQIFLKYDKKFYLYALYNKNKPKSDALMSEYGTLFFKSKQIELGDKMDLASYLLKPVQRMGKYALLLQQMMKACPPSPGTAPERMTQEIDDLKLAEEMVRFQLRHGNDLLAMDSIRECDVNLKEQGRLLRQNEFLVWEGRSGKKSLRQVFLFEELILFSKAKRFPDNKNLDLYYYKNSIKMTDIGLTPKLTDSSTKFEIWFRKRKPNDTFILQSMSQEVKKAWTEELSQLLWRQAIKNRAVRMAEMSSMGIGNKPCLDIRPSVDQISHRSISIAQLSKSAPRFRNSISSVSGLETCRTIKRPHSVISMSSVSSGSTSSGGSGGLQHGASVSCESSCESPKPYHRSATLDSQCSMESGIIADMSVGSDECTDQLPLSL